MQLEIGDIWNTLDLRVNHLEERHKDFERKGWTERY